MSIAKYAEHAECQNMLIHPRGYKLLQNRMNLATLVFQVCVTAQDVPSHSTTIPLLTQADCPVCSTSIPADINDKFCASAHGKLRASRGS